MRRIRALGLGLALLVLPLIPQAASAAEHERATVVVAYGDDGGYAYYGHRDRDDYYRYRDRDDDYWRHHHRYRDRDDYRGRRHHRHVRRYRRDRDDWR